jgi:hypothetical protein
MKEYTPFDFVDAIYSGKNLITDESTEKQYNSFLINRALSFGADTIIQANEMNCRPHLEKRMQNTFLLNMVRPKKRFNKWLKGKVKSEDVLAVQEYYGYSYKKARACTPLFSVEQLTIIKEKLYKGGGHG